MSGGHCNFKKWWSRPSLYCQNLPCPKWQTRNGWEWAVDIGVWWFSMHMERVNGVCMERGSEEEIVESGERWGGKYSECVEKGLGGWRVGEGCMGATKGNPSTAFSPIHKGLRVVYLILINMVIRSWQMLRRVLKEKERAVGEWGMWVYGSSSLFSYLECTYGLEIIFNKAAQTMEL